MSLNTSTLNKLLLFKLPSAYLCGVRAKVLEENQCVTSVTHKWINQNPFKSMYFAVQAMAAELSTGALVMYHIDKSKANVSMLVASCQCSFSKKATGKVSFKCVQGTEVEQAIQKAMETGEGILCSLISIGTDEAGDEVSRMVFEWTFKRRKQ
ncbi:DUF4442 domain-containing protein [Flavobacterium silvaticum]|uniref:DUF4442 domain-containing protein n=1 Tax=Flavobacterium silvaticum TaxID=1852020 RepID=A0A972FXA4_9FLAO|nr:DUF4442 domain-containing protein [Flavobacterium silvaticum]NMH29330.1 DUF4442 domain-containing protein [Flavobacterium silvaticum]